MTIDNGYTGDMEIAADILLVDDARYFVQVDEFFEKSGRYTLRTRPIFPGAKQVWMW
jgi:hypothetical protein